jgi:hypothetical protein
MMKGFVIRYLNGLLDGGGRQGELVQRRYDETMLICLLSIDMMAMTVRL